MNNEHGGDSRLFRFRWNVLLIAFVLIGGFFLLTEHRAHVFGMLPYLLLLACPLLHLFGHGHHRKYEGKGGDDASHPHHH